MKDSEGGCWYLCDEAEFKLAARISDLPQYALLNCWWEVLKRQLYPQ